MELEELEQEVELLEAVFVATEELEVQWKQDVLHVLLHLAPLTGGDEMSQFVRCDLSFEIGLAKRDDPVYPDVPPFIQLGACEGWVIHNARIWWRLCSSRHLN